MADYSTRQELIDYAKRKLGAPVLEINVADEQIEDLVDDALQYFHERHYDGVQQIYLKYQFTQEDIDRGRSPNSQVTQAGIVTTTASATIDGATTTFSYKENSNYIQIPPAVIGINKIFKYDGTNTVTNNMFSVKYQMFLNDIYYFGSTELLTYAMTKTYLEDMDFLLTTMKQIRFNQRVDRLYLDIDYGAVGVGDYIVIDCMRLVDPNDFSRFTTIVCQNVSYCHHQATVGTKSNEVPRVKLPGGVELNGRQIYDDAEKDIEKIMEKMSNTYEIPPLDMIG